MYYLNIFGRTTDTQLSFGDHDSAVRAFAEARDDHPSEATLWHRDNGNWTRVAHYEDCR